MNDLMSNFKEIVSIAGKLKTVMLKKNLKIAKAKCPKCESGYLHGRIGGHKNHLHMYCDSCTVLFME